MKKIEYRVRFKQKGDKFDPLIEAENLRDCILDALGFPFDIENDPSILEVEVVTIEDL